MRLLWSLPKAAPALLRHFAAYIDLASLDLTRACREFVAEFVATAIMAVCGLTRRESYRDIVAITLIKTAGVFVVIGAYYLFHIV